MPNPSLPATQPSFEELNRLNDHGAEYWSARDLQPLLGYSQWRRFEDAIERAKTSCEQSGNKAGHHFAGAGKMVELGSGSARTNSGDTNEFRGHNTQLRTYGGWFGSALTGPRRHRPAAILPPILLPLAPVETGLRSCSSV